MKHIILAPRYQRKQSDGLCSPRLLFTLLTTLWLMAFGFTQNTLFAQCSPTLNGVGDGGTLSICTTDLPYLISVDPGSISPMASGTVMSADLGANFTPGINTGQVESGATVGSYSVSYMVSMDASNTCNVGDMATITLTIDDAPNAPTITPTTANLCVGDTYNIMPTASANSASMATFNYTLNAGTTGATLMTNADGTATVQTVGAAGTITVDVTETNACGTSTAMTTVSLTVNEVPSAANITGDAMICSGDNTNLVVDISDGASPYTVVYNDGTADATENAYVSGANINVAPTVTTTYMLVSVTDANGCDVPTGNLTGSPMVIVEGPVTINSDPSNVSDCNGATATFSVAASNGGSGTLLYQWQSSPDGNAPWTDLTNGGAFSGVNNATLTISPIDMTMDGNFYRAQVTTTTCSAQNSMGAMLTVTQAVTIDTDPMDQTLCAGESATFMVAASSGMGTPTYQWQISTDNGVTFTDLSDAGVYTGTMTNTLMISDVVGLDANQYRAVASVSACSIPSMAATLTVDGALIFTTNIMDESACEGEPLTLMVDAMNDGAGTILYQWQINDNGNFINLTNTAPYSGVMTNALTISSVTGLDNEQYRVQISTTDCTPVNSNVSTLTVNPKPAVFGFADDNEVCVGLTTNLNGAVVVGTGVSHEWKVADTQPAGFTGMGTVDGAAASTNQTAVFMATAAGMIRLEYRSTDGTPCTSEPAVVDINVLSNPAVNPIVGANTVCPASTETYSLTNNTGNNYQWTLSGGGTITSSTTSTSITVDWNASTGGPHTLTLVETNAGNCMTTNTLMINIVDMDDPTFACIADQNFNTNADADGTDCEYTVADNSLDLTVSDNCNVNTILHDYNGGGTTLMGAIFPLGTTTVTWTVTDVAGNASSCSFTVTVADNNAPGWGTDPTDLTLECDGTSDPNGDINTWLNNIGNGTATDNCSTVTYMNDYTALSDDCGATGTAVVTFTATDMAGNNSTRTAMVTIEDTSAPMWTTDPMDLTLECDGTADPNGDIATWVTNIGNGTANDACGMVTYTNDYTVLSDDCGATGTAVVTFTATDECGLTATRTATVTIEDTTAPTFDQAPAVIADIACSDALPVQETLTASDICGSATVTPSVDPFTPACSGYAITYRWTATDECNNTSEVTQTFNVVADTDAPTFTTFPTDWSITTDNINALTEAEVEMYLQNNGFMDATAADNCFGVNLSSTTNFITDNLECPVVAIYEKIYFIEDACDNEDSRIFTVTVTDAEAPVAVCQDITVFLDDNGMASITGADVDNGSSDNCGDVTLSVNPNTFDSNDLGANTVTLTVVDAGSNMSTCTATVTVSSGDLMVSGQVTTEAGNPLNNATVNVNGTIVTNTSTDVNGDYTFGARIGDDVTITAEKNINYRNGLSTFDLVLIQSHIVQNMLFSSPYDYIAADANNNGTIATSDVVLLQALLLQNISTLPNNDSWRFIPADEVLVTPTNTNTVPNFTESISYTDLQQDETGADFIAVKVGDINDNAMLNGQQVDVDQRHLSTLEFKADMVEKDKGSYRVDIRAAKDIQLLGYQLALAFPTEKMRVERIEPGEIANLSIENFGVKNLAKGQLLMNWFNRKAVALKSDEVLFSLHFNTLEEVKSVKDLIQLDPTALAPEAYDHSGEIYRLQWTNETNMTPRTTDLQLQNTPNPFQEVTTIRFYLAEASPVTISILDAKGQTLRRIQEDLGAGSQAIELNLSDLPTGVLFYQIQTSTITATQQMVKQ